MTYMTSAKHVYDYDVTSPIWCLLTLIWYTNNLVCTCYISWSFTVDLLRTDSVACLLTEGRPTVTDQKAVLKNLRKVKLISQPKGTILYSVSVQLLIM